MLRLLQICRVRLQDDTLSWPVLIAYENEGQTDFIREFDESTVLVDQLTTVLAEPADWDSEHRYRIDTVNVSMMHRDDSVLDKVVLDLNATLRETLSRHEVYVERGLPVLFVTLK